MTAATRLASPGLALLVLSAGCPCHDPGPDTGPGPEPVTVTVAVQASDPLGNPLTFRWRATDGELVDANAPATSWTLPGGPGIHFAYVLVSNGKGGYLERRVALSTDDFGVPLADPAPVDLTPPPAPPPSGVPFRAVIRAPGQYDPLGTGEGDGIYLPDASMYFEDLATGAVTATVVTDQRGSYTIDNVRPGTYQAWCSLDASGFQPCREPYPYYTVVGDLAVNDPYSGPEGVRGEFEGRVVLSDGAPCGHSNEFFGEVVTGTATLLGPTGDPIAGPYRTNVWGHYGFSADPAATSIRFECEGAAPVTIAASSYPNPLTVFPDGVTPVVGDMSATLDDGTSVGLFLPPPAGPGSQNIADPEFFLAAKGIDSRLGACRYYQAIGAVTGCDTDGTLIGALTFDDWKRQTEMEPYLRSGSTEVVATYVNRVDLNLTRNHHSVAHGPDDVATYVCNHLGPADETQDAADAAIADAVAGRNLVACVAMDFRVAPGVNGDQPFTRFLIFGPSGELLPSVNLDGRREKFAPGVCVSCHGGDRYAGRFPTEPGVGTADIGAHFLPYDSGNFQFSTAPGLTIADQQAAIHQLNENLLSTRPNLATQELIAGWYATTGDQLDPSYLPDSWQAKPQAEVDFYHQVYARSCRTCHVAFEEGLNLDHYENLDAIDPVVLEDGALRMALSVCGGSASFGRTFSMPNSLRTHDLFWGSVAPVDQPAILTAFLASHSTAVDVPDCAIRPSPLP